MNKFTDIIINVIIPISAGIIIYFIPTNNFILIQIRNYFPDGLWAYSLTSSILIIWNRRIKLIWIVLIACLFIAFEVFQSLQFIKGTYDIKDIFIYLSFGLFALITNWTLNNKFLIKFQEK